jgi:hypothetical protein
MIVRELINLIGFEVDEGAIASTESKVKQSFESITNLTRQAMTVIGSGMMVHFAKGLSDKFTEVRVTLADIRSNLANTGNAAGKTAEQLNAMAGKLSEGVNYSRDDILKAEAQFTKFGTITKTHFEMATKAAIEFAAMSKTSVESASHRISLLMEHPERLRTLEREGVHFSYLETQRIRQMYQVGNLQGSQDKLLQAIIQHTKNYAENEYKAGDASKEFAKQVMELKIQFGEALFPIVKKVNEMLTVLIKVLKDISPIWKSHIVQVVGFITVLTTLSSLLPIVARAITMIGLSLKSLNLPLLLLSIAFVLLAKDFDKWKNHQESGLGKLLGKYEVFVDRLRSQLKGLSMIWEGLTSGNMEKVRVGGELVAEKYSYAHPLGKDYDIKQQNIQRMQYSIRHHLSPQKSSITNHTTFNIHTTGLPEHQLKQIPAIIDKHLSEKYRQIAAVN